MTGEQLQRQPSPLKRRLHTLVFEADTAAGRRTDEFIIACILLSVAAAMLDSVAGFHAKYGIWLYRVEWFFTIIFTIEYAIRLYCVARPFAYATSFFGIVDLLAILPTWISLFVPGSEYLLVIRILRVLRIFRVLKIAEYFNESQIIIAALRASRRKIGVFLFGVCTLAVVVGALMYVIEGPDHGFTSIPRSIYWAIVTLTTVGYGDIAPETFLGQILACVVMILGYGIIAVPTGIVTVEMTNAMNTPISTQACPACGAGGHDHDAKHCKFCGERL